MKNLPIMNLQHNMIDGITIMLPSDGTPYKERYFEWQASNLTASFSANEITGGVLQSWHHVPLFNEVETHCDREMFYFVQGKAIMLFVDVIDNKPLMDTIQIARISPGTQMIIEAGKGHFIAVAEDNDPVYIVVVSPKMNAPRMSLPEDVKGV